MDSCPAMNQSVMIVDDDPGVSKSAALVLASRGYRVVRAASGEECLATVRGGFQGVILMDIMMPGLSGWDTIRALLAECLLGERQLICMLTARPGPGRESEGLQEWVFDYLSKPFDNEQLLSMVGNASELLGP